MKVTPVPEQTFVAELEIVTVAVWVGLTVKLIPFEVAELLLKQAGKVPDVETTALIKSPFDGVKVKMVPVDCEIPFLNQV